MSEVDCPRAKSWMTPCIARDGHTALADDGVCVGCGEGARSLLLGLAERYQPARRYVQTKEVAACADRLRDLIAEYVEAKESPPSKPSTRTDRQRVMPTRWPPASEVGSTPNREDN